ncbi:MAG TPA: hypothetical protein VGA25_05895 [Burkholderiales bacterium]|jgi:hypothetical protein
MSRSTAKAVATWDLGGMLAVLCQVAQDAGDAESAPQAVETLRVAGSPPATDGEEIRP